MTRDEALKWAAYAADKMQVDTFRGIAEVADAEGLRDFARALRVTADKMQATATPMPADLPDSLKGAAS